MIPAIDAAPRSTQTELRNLLGCFLFSEDDVFKTIKVLSGELGDGAVVRADAVDGELVLEAAEPAPVAS